MYYAEIKENYLTGNYSENIKQPYEEYIELDVLPEKRLDFYKVVDTELVFDENKEIEANGFVEIEELENFLKETDWYAIRFADEGTEIPNEIKQKRKEARNRISELRTIKNSKEQDSYEQV